MTLLRDVISIPERASAEDYVLKLTEGVGADRLASTVEQYVVTDQIAANGCDASTWSDIIHRARCD